MKGIHVSVEVKGVSLEPTDVAREAAALDDMARKMSGPDARSTAAAMLRAQAEKIEELQWRLAGAEAAAAEWKKRASAGEVDA